MHNDRFDLALLRQIAEQQTVMIGLLRRIAASLGGADAGPRAQPAASPARPSSPRRQPWEPAPPSSCTCQEGWVLLDEDASTLARCAKCCARPCLVRCSLPPPAPAASPSALVADAARCRSCGAPIEWARTTNGKALPLDVGEFDAGNIDLEDGLALYVLPLPGVARRRSHFASCPNADAHRR